MALADPATRTLVQSAHMRAIYGLFKGRAGDEDSILVRNLVSRLFGLQAKTDPAAGTIVFYVQDAAGVDTFTLSYDGQLLQRAATPYHRLKGLEASGVDMRLVEDAGFLKVQTNTGSEAVPVWVDRFTVNLATGAIVGGTYNAITVADSGMNSLVAAAYFGGF